MMNENPPSFPPAAAPAGAPRNAATILILGALWLLLFFAALFSPPLLDDADATHAQAARAMVTTGDLVTLHVDGIRYLEKAPLPYWLVAICYRLFGFNTFATHLPQAVAVLLLALLGWHWGTQSFGERTGFYTGLSVLTSAGIFLFTRIFIPEVLLSLLLAVALFSFLKTLTPPSPRCWPYAMWAALALAVLTKGLVALVFFFGAAAAYLLLTRELSRWRLLRPLTGGLLLLAIAAPWHVLAGLRNTGGADGHGFLWFYFVNEHFLRFLGRRIPRDYNKLPGSLFWSLHLVWLFPWSLFAPLALDAARRRWRSLTANTFQQRSVLLLGIFSSLVLVFFSLSTNQEYYTFPAYLPLLLLLSAALARAEQTYPTNARWITFAHAALTLLGAAFALTLGYGLWTSRHLPFVPDIGALLAHRGVGDYTLSMSHLFDLTGPSFAALRLPAALAAAAFACGPALAWTLRHQRRHIAATSAIALTSAVFLIAAHIALTRFAPMLSSQSIAAKIQTLRATHSIAPDTRILLFGDQSYGSSIPFYLGRQVALVDGRSSSMLFGSSFSDAPPIFLTSSQLAAEWGTGARKLLFVPLEERDTVDHLLGPRQILLEEISGKALVTDRPLDPPPQR
ncbi:glycosyl transferase [Granulicella sp. WH15]|uniref:ArnT family glycosyltransferase n=1 Tax=Granulicella sp. WH15 TaxID=2602070 RepID=UPI00136785EE|nr:glycosyltransferase family 39 protein [Granulicella sp. WH15]QHN02222.1 glycosyl transferase [Granulicella sp. WH15]